MAPTYSIMMWQKLWWIDACRDAFVGLFVSLLLSMRVPTCRPSIFTIWQFFFRRAMWVGTVLITTYLSSLQIPKENKSWVVFTSKKKSSAMLFIFFFTEFVSKNFMGDLQPWKYKKNSGVVWSFLGWWEWWVRLWVRFPTRNMMCFKFFCCKISRKNNF